MTSPSRPGMPALVDRWVAAGIITPEQAERIRADYATLAPAGPVSLVAEGLGYLGGVIVVIGLGLVLGLSWDKLNTDGRIGVAAGIAVALGVAGAFIPVPRLGAAGARLRGVLWVGATVAVFAGAQLIGDERLDWADHPDRELLLAAGCAAVASAALWTLQRHVLQQFSTMVWLSLTAFAIAWVSSDSWLVSSLALWGVGVVWFLLSAAETLPSRSGAILGALGAIIGGFLMLGEGSGPLIALGTVLALVVVAVARRELALLAISSVGTLVALPVTVDRYLPGGALSTALALVLGGLALIAAGVYTARRRRDMA